MSLEVRLEDLDREQSCLVGNIWLLRYSRAVSLRTSDRNRRRTKRSCKVTEASEGAGNSLSDLG